MASRPGPANVSVENLRRTVVATVVALSHNAASGADAGLAYDNHEINIGDAVSRTVLHGRLTGGETDDLIVFTHADSTRQMAVYTYHETAWSRCHLGDVARGIIFVDMMELGGEDRLLALRRGGIDWIDPATWVPRTWLASPSMYKLPPQDVPDFDFARDVNGDGLDDIALPGFDGYTVWTQRPDGTLNDPVELAAPATARVGFRSATYRARDLYQLDHDGDGYSDLAFWHEGGLVVYPGAASGSFVPDPIELLAPFELSTDDVTVSFGFGQEFDETRSLLYRVDDFNGDGIGDIATSTIEVAGVFDQSTRYDFHFGRREAGATVFRAVPDTSISSEGVQGPLELSDLDGDGRLDFGMLSFKMGIGKIVAVLLTGSVGFNMNFYLMGEGGYARKPNVQRRVKLRLDLGSGRVSGNWVSAGDLTGDGIKDLVVQVDGTRVDVYPGTGGADLFTQRPVEVDVNLSDQGSVRLADLNHDGKDDMFMAYRHPDGETLRVGVALSR